MHRRVDDSGRAFKGSQRSIQYYVNRAPDALNTAIQNELPNLPHPITWVSPLEAERYAEYQDKAFLKALRHADLWPQLSSFWPRGGPVWDGLATTPDGGVVLVEAKSHLAEVFGIGCQASATSRPKIDRALAAARRWVGADGGDWLGALYQSANRLAHLYFFREIAVVPAWLVNVYFVDDPYAPTSRAVWQEGLTRVRVELGCSTQSIPFMASVFLPAAPDNAVVR